MKHFTALGLAILCSGPAWGFSCAFDRECYEDEACGPSGFLAEVEIDEERLVTDFGDLTIVAVKQGEALITLFATGAGAEYMMSVAPDGTRLSVHMNDGPAVATYLGECEGAF